MRWQGTSKPCRIKRRVNIRITNIKRLGWPVFQTQDLSLTSTWISKSYTLLHRLRWRLDNHRRYVQRLFSSKLGRRLGGKDSWHWSWRYQWQDYRWGYVYEGSFGFAGCAPHLVAQVLGRQDIHLLGRVLGDLWTWLSCCSYWMFCHISTSELEGYCLIQSSRG